MIWENGKKNAIDKCIVTTHGKHKELPLRLNIFGTKHKNIVVGARLTGCPESLQCIMI